MAAKEAVIYSKRSPSVSVDNVLLLPEILENVFKFLSLSDLLNCRYVNRQWKKVSTPFIAKAKKKPIRFSDIVIFEHNFIKLHGFLATMIDAAKIPVTEFVLMISHVTYREPIIKKFLKICGGSVLRMDTKCRDQNSRADLLWDSFLLKMPNLEKLKLKIETEETEGVSYYSPADVINYCLPKLERLVFDCEDSTMLMDLIKVSPKLKAVTLKSSKNFLALSRKELGFQSRLKKVVLSDSDVFVKAPKFSKIMEAGFTLTHLNLDECTFSNELAVGPLLQFVASQSETLKVLIMPKLKDRNPGNYASIPFHMPKMNKLQRLRLNTKWDRVFHISSWTQFCPDLTSLETEKIVYDTAAVENIFPTADDNLPHKNLAKLTIPYCCTSKQFLLRLAKAFPNIKDFTIIKPIPVTIILPLWTMWPGLKALSMTVLSDGFMGASPSDHLSALLLGIDYLKYVSESMENSEIADLHMHMVEPCITNLTELESLQIEGPLFDRDAKASILKLKKLRSLRIYESHITRLCAEEIIRKLPNLKDWCFRNFATSRDQALYVSSIKSEFFY